MALEAETAGFYSQLCNLFSVHGRSFKVPQPLLPHFKGPGILSESVSYRIQAEGSQQLSPKDK